VQSMRWVIDHNGAPELFRALHTSPGFLDPSQFDIVPQWDDDSIKEPLELYLTGFSLSMLAGHCDTTTEDIVRSLSAVVYDDHALVTDRLKARHQKAWVRQEMQFLITQMQVGATPTAISVLMERDSLGISYKLFEPLPVPIPKTVMDTYGISHGQEPLELGAIEKEPFYQAATGMRERNGKMAQYIVWVLVAMVVFGGGHHVVSTAVEGRVGPVGAGQISPSLLLSAESFTPP